MVGFVRGFRMGTVNFILRVQNISIRLLENLAYLREFLRARGVFYGATRGAAVGLIR